MKFIYSKVFIIFSGILVIIFIALFMQARGWLQPVEYVLLQAPRPVVSVVNWVTRPVVTTFETLFSLRNLVDQNNQLQVTVSGLQNDLVGLDQLKSENQILKDELGFVAKNDFNLEPCTILSSDNQNLTDVINLSCGKKSGIQEGFAVVSQSYIIAKVVHVGEFTSAAVLITNAQQSIDAKISKNNTEGVVKGSFGSGLVFDLVSQSAEIESGDLLVTAGIDPKIPRDILIGQIGQELSGQNDLFKKLTVSSPVKIHAIDFVMVVKP